MEFRPKSPAPSELLGTPDRVFTKCRSSIGSDHDFEMEESDFEDGHDISSSPGPKDVRAVLGLVTPCIFQLLRHDPERATQILSQMYQLSETHEGDKFSMTTWQARYSKLTKRPINGVLQIEDRWHESDAVEGAAETHTHSGNNENETSGQSDSSGITSGATGLQTNNQRQTSRARKRDRSPRDPQRPRGSPDPKKSKQYNGIDFTWNYACPFHKDEPWKYGPWSSNRGYHNCVAPRIPESRLRSIL